MAMYSPQVEAARQGLKSELAQYGYYYAYGAALGGQLALRVHALESGIDVRWERFGSIEGLDRFQERLNRDFHQVDGRSRALAWLSLRLAFGELGVSLEQTHRTGAMADVRVLNVELRGTVTLGFGL